jgi:hypothetical protein
MSLPHINHYSPRLGFLHLHLYRAVDYTHNCAAAHYLDMYSKYLWKCGIQNISHLHVLLPYLHT